MSRRRKTPEALAVGSGPFTLHLDYRVYFIPPMDEDGHGLTLTRELRLPFVPREDTIITGRAIDGFGDPEGVVLKDVVWDIDRYVFMAHTDLCQHDMPLAEIPVFLRGMVSRGWRFGSYKESCIPDFGDEDDRHETISEGVKAICDEWDRVEGERMATWKGRSAEANTVLRALIRTMAEVRNNEAIAYAMQKTGRIYLTTELEPDKTTPWDKQKEVPPERKKFVAHIEAYASMSVDAQERWRERTRRYTALEELVTGKRRRKGSSSSPPPPPAARCDRDTAPSS